MRFTRPRFRFTVSFLWALVMLSAIPFQASDICVPAIGGLAGVPTIDGVVSDEPGAHNTDAGWNGATRINLGEYHGATRSGTMEAGTSGNSLYLSFVIATPMFTNDNTIVLGFSPQDDNSQHDWRIHIVPFDVGVVDGVNKAPHSVTYWRDSATWNTGAGAQTATAGTWLIDNVRYSKVGSNWAVEMKVPIVNAAQAGGNTGFFIPAGNFRLYVDVLNTSAASSNAVQQDSWPPNQQICAGANPCGGDTFLTHNTPPITNWGVGSTTLRPACAAVSLGPLAIGVQDPSNAANIINSMRRAPGPFGAATPADCIGKVGASGANNVFIARPKNNGAASANVSATFRLANWGIPGLTSFDPLPPPAAPSTAVKSIAPGGTTDLTDDWALTFEQSCRYSFHDHQCIQVDLDSPDLGVVFENKSVQRNMNFVEPKLGKKMTMKAYINGNQGALPAGAATHRFLLAIETALQGRAPTGGGDRGYRLFPSDQLSLVYNDRRASYAAWIARGLLYTGKTVRINRTTYEIVSAVGDFGYVARNDDATTEWQQTLSGERLQRVADNLYTVEVAPSGEEVLEVGVEGDTPGGGTANGGRWLSIHAGLAFPHGDFEDFYDHGHGVAVDYEHVLNPQWSIEGFLGWNRFSSNVFVDENIYNLTVGPKYYFRPAPVRPFALAGVGVYKADPGNTRFGANLGLGLHYDIQPKVGLELTYAFHWAGSSSSSTKRQFSTLQAGVTFAF